MQTTIYTLTAPVAAPTRIALVSDLHDRDAAPVLAALDDARPDFIAITGDVFDGHRRFLAARDAGDARPIVHRFPNAMRLLEKAPAIAPAFLSLGNHEWFLLPPDLAEIRKTGTTLLHDAFCAAPGGLIFAGLTPHDTSRFWAYAASQGYRGELGKLRRAWRALHEPDEPAPASLAWLDDFQNQPGVKVLLCHYPEYWALLPPYLKDSPVDLMLSGHAHGGQVRLLGRGLFSSSQGFFPRFTNGVFTGAHGHMVISRGLANTVPIPRIGNPTQLVLIDLSPCIDS